jgi:RecB family exonuclease
MNEELRLSVSKTKTFLSCKKKYEYTYIQKLPRKTQDFYTVGKFCHKALEDFHKIFMDKHYMYESSRSYSIIMSKIFKDTYNLYKIDMTLEMKKECWDILNNYLKIISNKKVNNSFINVIACEKGFEYNIENKIILNGSIDRIQLDDDNIIHIADYKTTKNKKYLKDDFFQLLTYAYIILMEDPSIDKIRASYILLRHDFEYITTEFIKSELIKVKDLYIDYANKILSEKEFKSNPTNLCKFCDYINVCEEGKKTDFSSIFGEVTW